MSPVQLQFSGSTRVADPRAEIELNGRPQRSLLAMLAMRVGEKVSADQLIEWTWGGSLPDNPLGALQTRLSRLRSSLGEYRDILASSGDAYVLDVEPNAIDLVRFENAALEHSGNIERLVEVDSWWKGLPFADAEPLDVLLDERQRLEMVWLAGRGDIVDLLIERGQLEEAYAWCERTLKQQPFDERLMASQLSLAARLQLGKGVVTRYHLWRDRYNEIFGSYPPAELDELAEQVKGRTERTAREVLDRSEPVEGAVDYGRILDRAAETPIFGAQAKKILAADNKTTVVLGGHGFGNTVLAAAWRQRRLAAGSEVLVASGSNLDAVVRSLSSEGVAGLPGLAVVIDDLHLASDNALNDFSKVWLELDSDIRFFITSRPPLPGTRSQRVLATLSMGKGALVHRLAPVGVETIDGVVEEQLGTDLEPEYQVALAGSVARATGGHPAALDQMVRGIYSHVANDLVDCTDGHAAGPNESEVAPVIASLFEDEFAALSIEARAIVALASVTPRPVPTFELAGLLDQMAEEGVITRSGPNFSFADVAAAHSSGLVGVGSERVTAYGSVARFVVRQYAPALLTAATKIMARRASARDDRFDLTVQTLLDPTVPVPDAIDRVLDAMIELKRTGSRAEVLELGERLWEYGWLKDQTDPALIPKVASIHLLIGRAAEQEGLHEQSDRHLHAALRMGVKNDLEEVVIRASTGWGEHENPYRSSASASRHSVANAWATRRGSEHAKFLLEAETLRRMRRRRLDVSPERLESLEAAIPHVAPASQSHAWGLIAEVLLARPLSEVGDRVECALARGEAAARQVDSVRLHHDDPELLLHKVRGAYALRRGQHLEADDAIQRLQGLADFSHHRVYTWYALAQITSLEVLRSNDAAWHRAVMKAVSWGRKFHVYYEDPLEWHLTVAGEHFGIPVPDLGRFDIDRLATTEFDHPARQLAYLSVRAEPADDREFRHLWEELSRLPTSVLTPSAVVYSARAARRIGAEGLYGEILAGLVPYSGEFATLPSGAVPVGYVDVEIAALEVGTDDAAS